MARIGIGKVLAGVAIAAVGAAAGAAAWYLAKEKASERPDHAPIETDGAFELRDYPALIVAETVAAGARDKALGSGFGMLADYIFAENREGEEIAMTVPVLASPTGERRWLVRLVMPAIWTRETLPPPGEGVEIGEIPARRVATVGFSGRADDGILAVKEAELRAWMGARGLKAARVAEHAFYNSPYVPGPLRHSEVIIAVE